MSQRNRGGATTLPAALQKRRCAVYTRVSTDEQTNREYNSLHAQRDACEAFVASQRAEGWVLVEDATTTAGFPVAHWTGQRWRGCSRTSKPGASMWWWFTRSTGSVAR
jgi:hypothetical protein